MASRILYGICEVRKDEPVKRVYIDTEEIGSFNAGDLLVVYFVNGNTASNPTLKLYNNTTNEQEATNSDSGYYIKNELGVNDAIDLTVTPIWKSKETIVFCYTANNSPSDANDAYYWCIIEGGIASLEEYGVTTLFDLDTNSDFINWLKNPTITEDDKKKALTPATLKRLYQTLSGMSIPEDTPTGISWLKYQPIGTNPDDIGKLILGIGDDPEDILSEVTITAPIQSMIDRMGGNIQYTGELINNGENGSLPVLDEKNTYITSYPPYGLYFGHDRVGANNRTLYAYINGEDKAFLTLGDNNARLIVGNEEHNTIIRGQALRFDSDRADVNVSQTFIGNSSTSQVSVTGQLQVSGQAKALELFEDNVSLKNKYERKLNIIILTSPEIIIGANSYATGNIEISPVLVAAHNILGVVGFNISNWSQKYSGCHYCVPYAIFCDKENSNNNNNNDNTHNDIIRYNITNTSNQERHIKLRVRVLYSPNY